MYSLHFFLQILIPYNLAILRSDELAFMVLFTCATRLYTEEYFVNEMAAEGIPEIQRSNLVSCVIQVCSFLPWFCHVKFSWMHAYLMILLRLQQTASELRRIGAEEWQGWVLTQCGFTMKLSFCQWHTCSWIKNALHFSLLCEPYHALTSTWKFFFQFLLGDLVRYRRVLFCCTSFKFYLLKKLLMFLCFTLLFHRWTSMLSFICKL